MGPGGGEGHQRPRVTWIPRDPAAGERSSGKTVSPATRRNLQYGRTATASNGKHVRLLALPHRIPGSRCPWPVRRSEMETGRRCLQPPPPEDHRERKEGEGDPELSFLGHSPQLTACQSADGRTCPMVAWPGKQGASVSLLPRQPLPSSRPTPALSAQLRDGQPEHH